MNKKEHSKSGNIASGVVWHTIVFKVPAFFKKMFGAMHFINYINRSIATKVDSTYLGY